MTFVFFNDTATTEIYTLSLHDALPISTQDEYVRRNYEGILEPVGYENADQIHADLVNGRIDLAFGEQLPAKDFLARSEEHTSELQSRQYLVCRLLLEKKKTP